MLVTNRVQLTGRQMKCRELLRIVLSMIGITMLIVLMIVGTGFGDVKYLDVNDLVQAKVRTASGKILWYENMNLPELNAGDQIDFYIQLPERQYEGMNTLCFYQYHSEIDVFLGEELLYSKGKDLTAEKKMHGNEFCTVMLPYRCWGERIRVHVRQIEGMASRHFTYFRLMCPEDARLYPLIGNRMAFLFFGVMLLLSTCLFVITIFSQIFQQAIPPSMIRIALFCFLTSTWQLSYRRLFYMMISNTQICALTEYYALYLAPVPLFTYLAEMKRKKSLQMIYYGIAVAYFLIFCGINFADMKYHVHLIRIESLMYILFFISACVVIGIELFGGGQLNEPRNLILRAGLLMFLAFNLLQIILLVVTESLENSRVIGILQRVDLSSLGIVIFMISVITAVSQTAIRMVRQNAADAQLRVLAVTDELTGIPNRRYCEMRLHELRSMANYGIVFLDVDGLKKANDMYGHDMGDKLIRKVAEIMRESFSFEEGFFGRWGGDEFLVVCAEAHEAELFAENLEILQEEVNRKGEFPFPVSISYGIAYNDPRSARKAEEVRREADRKMYERKKQRPQRRSF